jgi:hypothetical protein
VDPKSQRPKSYNVAFVGTAASGYYEGVITWSSYLSKEEFDKAYTPEMRAKQAIVEEGITDERAVELAKQTPEACIRRASLANLMGRW